MRNRTLHDHLHVFAERAAEHLQSSLESGLEIPFEVDERPGQTSVLYHYKPLSERFVRERFGELRRLEGFGPALLAVTRIEGISAYLRVLGISYVPTSERDRAEAVLREFLTRVWEEVSGFELEEKRFERAYRELESVVYENTIVNTVLAPLPGVRLAAERWDLGAGLELVRGDLCEAPPEAVWTAGREESDPKTLAVITVEATPQDPPPLTAARITFRKLLTTLRLLKPGGATLGSTAWWRLDDGPWQAVPLGHAGRVRAPEYWLEEQDRRELAELFELVRVRPLGGGSLPWALRRFEMGCEQHVAMEGLSDHLLAVRALLDGGEASPANLASRLAVLCAEPAGRRMLAQGIERAFELERLVMRGEPDGARLGAPADRIAHELEHNLRAILRDMVCGYLGADVRRIADELLMAEAAAKPEPRIEARAAGRKPPARRTEPVVERWDDVIAHEAEAPEPVEPPQPPDAHEPRFSRARSGSPAAGLAEGVRSRVARLARPAEGKPQRPKLARESEQKTDEVAVGGFGWRPEGGSADWGFDDDPDDFTAAV